MIQAIKSTVATNAKKVWSKLTQTWVDVGNGTTAPDNSTNEHSGSYGEEIAVPLPPGTYIKNGELYRIPVAPEPSPLAEQFAALPTASQSNVVELPVKHEWHRGVLPGGRYVRTCSLTQAVETITKEQWDQTGI